MSMTPSNKALPFLREDRLPHIWCPGCGIGTVLGCFTRAIADSGISSDKLVMVSGIGCTGRAAGYIKLDSFHTTHGRAIPFATGLSLSLPQSKVVVFSGDGDLSAIGGNHLIHAARRNVDMTVICVNNYTYGMTGGQVTPTTPNRAKASTTPYGSFEDTFNLPQLVDACGAPFIARWTSSHVRRLTKTMTHALLKKGFSFIEVVSPCPTLFGRRNKLGDGAAMMLDLKNRSEVRDGAPTSEVAMTMGGVLAVGEFVNKDTKTFRERYEEQMSSVLGNEFVPYSGAQ